LFAIAKSLEDYHQLLVIFSSSPCIKDNNMNNSRGSKRFPIGIILFLAVAYIGFGDSVLPGVAGQYSYQTRATLNQMMINIFPSWKPKTNPYRRTEDAIQKNQ
jgi:hypothetical protein